MNKSTILFVLILISIKQLACLGLEKYWLADVEWENPNNWLDNKMPEFDDRIIFPLEQRHAVGMPRIITSMKLSGFDLPSDGLVALPENGKLLISERGKSSGQSRWKRETPYFWVDPLNWNVKSEAVPHLERLPCQSDLVILPASTKTFSMRLPETRAIEVSAVKLENDNQTFARWEWRSMAEKAEFLGSWFSIKYSPLMACKNCPCQEGDLSEYSEEICNVVRPRCGFPECVYPLKVEGHCCYYCGGRIKLAKKTLLNTAQRVAKKVLKSYENTLFWHSRITWDGYSEILITEKERYTGTNTIIAITDVETALKEEGIDIVYSETSGDPMYDNRLAVAFGPLLGVTLVLIVLIIILCPMYGYSYSQIWEACQETGAAMCFETSVNGRRKRKSFAFARFENIFEGNVQIAEEEETSIQSTTGERFENPLYRSKRHSKSSGKGQDKSLDPNEPVSLVALEKAIELDRIQDVEMDIENL